jgi:heme a synthase
VRRSTHNPALTGFAVFTAISTLFLICVGGLVTSHGAGMAVPDWPTTYGYNMFLFPISQWVGGIFYEHTHRLVASGVGFLTMILAAWLWLKEERRWLRWLGAIAFVAVCVQGVLGGLRVTLFKQELGIFHATLAQLFLLLVSLIALFLSARWQRRAATMERARFHPAFRPLLLFSTIAILVQLILGASMRHQHAGLAVPDFPLAYGKIWPDTDAAALDLANRSRHDYRDFSPITAGHIYLHMTHRITACVILLAVGAVAFFARKGERHPFVARFASAWFGLILFQAFLGAYTVWSNKAADVATAHVAFGAVSLVAGGLLYAVSSALAARASVPVRSAAMMAEGAPVLG